MILIIRIVNVSFLTIIGSAVIVLMFPGKSGVDFLIFSAAVIICVFLYENVKEVYRTGEDISYPCKRCLQEEK